jgi:hypothetical protein
MFWYCFISLLPLLPIVSQYHKSPFTYAAIVLAILSFIFSGIALFSLILSALALVVVLLTICMAVPRPVLLVGMLLALLAGIADFIVAAQLNDGAKIVIIFGGFLWIFTAIVVYQIPPPTTGIDSITSCSSSNMPATSSTSSATPPSYENETYLDPDAL